MTPDFGPYERLYAASPSLWRGHVGKLVTTYADRLAVLASDPSDRRALDLGAGEGDNAIFLASRGFLVDLVEVSPSAEANFKRRIAALDPSLAARLSFRAESVGARKPRAVYAAVIAYGLLHCFPTPEDARRAARYCVENVKPGGALIISCITDAIPYDEQHPELRSCYAPSEGDIEGWFHDLDEELSELEVVEEVHNDGAPHSHAIFRALYRVPFARDSRSARSAR
jgi:SAM-dependent methyltransferase